ncbi:MAG: potassium transporter TrkG [Mariniphaga sp.]|nr:potassium transporter TrkG [Mariniphaga sp.]
MSYRNLRKNRLFRQISRLPIIVSTLTMFFLIYDIGFFSQSDNTDLFQNIYFFTVFIGAISIIARYLHRKTRPKLNSLAFDIILFCFLSILILQYFQLHFLQSFSLFKHPYWLYIVIILVFIRELSALKMNFKKAVFNPAQLFLISFLTLIVTGSMLLMLPNATHSGITLIDAMFTSTSAVCVTGLIVVDTGSFFTQFGQIIILMLIQAGGIGIMTFTSYFSYFFKGVSSYENQLVLGQITNTEKIAEVFTVLKKIILITFLIEGLGALFIFQSIDSTVIPYLNKRIFFSVFHSISGFCNAGFSTLRNSFFEGPYQFNYPLHLIIASLIILGGLGFPIVFNLLKFIKAKIVYFLLGFYNKKRQQYIPGLININTRIVLITTLVLIVGGTLLFFLFEYNKTLSEHGFAGKIATAFFGAVTTRTAGFNTVDTAALSIPTLLIVIFLMWVGASPNSTGGGIKTSSFAIALLNILSIARGKSRLEVYNREISSTTVKKAFAIIVLSVFVISIAILSISLFEPDKSLLNISFECVSAYSTVGLSRGITADLSFASKLILIFTMFIGRVSTLTLLIAIIKKARPEIYRYPSESILIN